MSRAIYEVYTLWFVDDGELVDIFATRAGAEARIREYVETYGAEPEQYHVEPYQLAD